MLESGVAVDVLAEWRERYRSIQDGLAGLTDAQRICLMLQTAGASYERIREVTGFSLRKVERSVLEGRAGLARWELRLASGEACARLDEMIGRVAAAQATPRETPDRLPARQALRPVPRDAAGAARVERVARRSRARGPRRERRS